MPFDFNTGRMTEENENMYGHTPESRMKNSGFQDIPQGKQDVPQSTFPQQTSYTEYQPYNSRIYREPVRRRKRLSFDWFALPWNRILPVIGIIAAVIFCWIFRREITEFLTQLLVWVIFIVILVVAVKYMIFGGRR